jgi:hypothetical protein
MFGLTGKLKMGGAESALKGWERIVRALQNEVGAFQDLISQRVESDRALVAAETSAAMGEPADVGAAQQRAGNVMASIARKAAVLGGLRARLAGQASGLESNVGGIKAALPEHVDELKADFQGEWARGIKTFGTLLGKRRALEALVGKLDELAEPQAATCDLGDVAAPWRVMKELTGAIDQIAGWSRGSIWPAVDGMGGVARPYDPSAVYVLTRPYDDKLPEGSLVMEASLPPGFLNHLVQIEYAVSLASQEWGNSTEVGRRASDRISFEERQFAAQASEPAAVGLSAKELEESRRASAEAERHRIEWPAHHAGQAG